MYLASSFETFRTLKRYFIWSVPYGYPHACFVKKSHRNVCEPVHVSRQEIHSTLDRIQTRSNKRRSTHLVTCLYVTTFIRYKKVVPLCINAQMFLSVTSRNNCSTQPSLALLPNTNAASAYKFVMRIHTFVSSLTFSVRGKKFKTSTACDELHQHPE